MKKTFIMALACIMAVLLAACGAPKDNPSSSNTEVSAPADNSSQAENTDSALNPVETLFFPATSPADGAYATIKVSNEVKMDDESAWLGLCPAGKDYITELEADDVDVIWFNADAREENDPYVFACDFSTVEDGTYALVVATSDDENVGYVAIQLEMTKDGDKLSFDFANAQLKERPAN